MEFWVTLIQTAIKMVLIAAVGFGGLCLGKKLRMRKNEKTASLATEEEK